MADPPFNYSFARTQGLNASELALLRETHEFFRLPYGDPQGKIAGVLLLPDGRRFAFVSGRLGGPQGGTQVGFIPRGRESAVNRFNVTHIEGHASANLHRIAAEEFTTSGVGEAALLLPKAPCGACDPSIPTMLPRGTRLFVVDPDATTVYQSVKGLTVEGPKFPRPTQANEMVIAPGGQGGVANFAFFVVDVFIQGIKQQNEQRDLQAKLEELDRKIRDQLADKMEEVALLQSQGKQARANVTFQVVKTERGIMDIATSFAFRLDSVSIDSESRPRKTDPIFNNKQDSLEDFLIPVKTETWLQTTATNITLPENVVLAFKNFKFRAQWFDIALGDAGSAESQTALRLGRERDQLIAEFRSSLRAWAREFLKPQPAPFQTPPAPRFSPVIPPPPQPPVNR